MPSRTLSNRYKMPKMENHIIGKEKAIDILEQFLDHDVPHPSIHGDEVYAVRYKEAQNAIRYLANWF